jgi:hypothetical protein
MSTNGSDNDDRDGSREPGGYASDGSYTDSDETSSAFANWKTDT